MAEENERHVVLYKKRWLVLFAVCLSSFSTNMTFVTFATISSFAVEFYGDANAPNLLSTVYLACSPIGFLAIYIMNKHDGLRISCQICAALNLLGNAIRAFAASNLFPALLSSTQALLIDGTVDEVQKPMQKQVWCLWLTILGQCICAIGNPFGMYLPPKVAAVWFPENQRVLVTSSATLSSVIGAIFMYGVAPLIVNTRTPDHFFVLLSLVFMSAALAAVVAAGVESRPPTPSSLASAISATTMQDAQTQPGAILRRIPQVLPTSFDDNDEQNATANSSQSSAAFSVENANDISVEIEQMEPMPATTTSENDSSNNQQQLLPFTNSESALISQCDNIRHSKGYFAQMFSALRTTQFVLLALVMGNGFGVVNTFLTIIQQVLCAHGFTPEFADVIGLIRQIGGLVGLPLAGKFVDRTHLFEETLKVLFSVNALTSIAFMLLFTITTPSTAIHFAMLVIALIDGMVSTPIYPIGLELGVETTFPLPEGTSTGLIVQIGQLQGIFWLWLLTQFRSAPTNETRAIQICTKPSDKSTLGLFDWRYVMIGYALLASGNALFAIHALKPELKRIKSEKSNMQKCKEQEELIEQNALPSPSTSTTTLLAQN